MKTRIIKKLLNSLKSPIKETPYLEYIVGLQIAIMNLAIMMRLYSILTKPSIWIEASGEFRFPLQKVSNQWWPCLVMGSTEGTLKVANSDGENNPLHVAADGNYQIVVNAAAMTYTITKK